MALGDARRPIRVLLLGGARLQTAEGEAIFISGKKGLALIAYLCQCQGMAATRDKLADLLWSNADNLHARNSLRQTLAVLRRELSSYEPDFLLTQHDIVGLRPLSVDCDVHRFVRAAATGSSDDDHVLAEGYTGPFLDGFFAGSDVFEDWASAERARLSGVAVIELERLARQTGGKLGLQYARRLLSVEPMGEGSHRLMMELLAANGHRDLALRQYDLCSEMLRKELGVSPSPETAQLRRTISAPQPTLDPKTPEIADRTQQSMEQRPSVGVQLFVNLTGGQAEEFFSRGLAQAIVTELSQHKELILRSDEVPRDIGAESPRVAEIASRLGVRYILAGSVQRANEHLRVSAHLVDTAAGDHVWAERYDGSVEEVLAFQDRVAQSMAFATRVQLLRARWKVRDKAPLDDPVARLLINRAVVKFYEMTRASLSASVALAERALQIDPDSAQAMRTLSFAMSVAMALGALAKAPETLKRAISLAEAAVAAVPDDEIARSALSFALLSADRLHEAVAEISYALILNPHYPNARGDLAEIYAFLGRTDEAIEEATEAIRLSFHDPADFWRHYALCVARFAAGDDSGALASARHVIRSKPDFVRGAVFWAAAAAASGNAEEASRAVELCLGQLPELRLGNVSPGFVPRYVREQHHRRFLDMLGKAGLPK